MSDITTNVKRVFSRGSHFVPPAPAPAPAPAPETNINFSISEVYDGDNENEPQVEFNPLDALNRDNYKPPEPEEKKPRGRPPKRQPNVVDDKILEISRRKQEQMMMKARPVAPTPSYHHNDGEEMSSDDILGKEVRGLYTRCMRYRSAFADNPDIMKIKIPKNAKPEQLQLVLLEYENILDMSCNIDTFLINSILQVLPIAEEMTADSDFDIRGLSKALKSNEQFMSQCKELFLKYSSVYSAPVEFRLAYSLIITTTNVILQNQSKRQIAGKTVDKTVLDELNDV